MKPTFFVAAIALAATFGPALSAEPVTGHAPINGLDMYYEIHGEGEPLVLLHGAYMSIGSNWFAMIPALSETRQVIAIDLQGHGGTSDADRPITYEGMADDVAALLDHLGIEKADIFGYSMGSIAGLQLAIRHPEKVDQLIAVSTAYDLKGWHQVYTDFIPQMSVEMFTQMPFMEEAYRELAVNPEGFEGLATKLIQLEKEPMAWEEDVKKITSPVLIIAGDADVSTLEHNVALFRLLGGGVMGDMGQPLPASRLAVLPATSHTAVIGQTELLHLLIEPFLKGETPKSFMGM